MSVYNRKSEVIIVLVGAPILALSIGLMSFYTETISNDFYQYHLLYEQIRQKTNILQAMITTRVEPGFVALYYYAPSYFDSSMLFLVTSSTILTLKYTIFLRYLRKPYIAWLVYLIVFLPVLDSSQLRTAIASVLIIYVLVRPDDKGSYVIGTLVASMFHYIGLTIYAIKHKNKWGVIFIGILVMTMMIDAISGYLQNDIFKVSSYFQSPSKGEINLLNTMVVSQTMIVGYCILSWGEFTDVQKRGAFMIGLGIFVYFTMADYVNIAHRFREISLLGIFPLLFSRDIRSTYTSLLLYIPVIYICGYYLYHTASEVFA